MHVNGVRSKSEGATGVRDIILANGSMLGFWHILFTPSTFRDHYKDDAEVEMMASPGGKHPSLPLMS